MNWIPVLVALGVLQIRFYELNPRRVIKFSFLLWMSVYWQLWTAELIRRFFSFVDLEWWLGVAISFVAFLIGEGVHFLFEREGRSIPKKWQTLPSFFTFSAIYLMIAWIFLANGKPSLGEVHCAVIVISSVSVFLTIIFSHISEQLSLLDAPVQWQELPIILVAASVLLLTFLEILKNFLP